MFCHKCGTVIADEAAFCYKCGAQMTNADSVQRESEKLQARDGQVSDTKYQPTVVVPTKPMSIQSQAASSHSSKEKSNLSLIFGVAVIVVVILIMGIAVIQKFARDLSSDSVVSLSKVYTNEAEGISFRYPSAWEVTDSATFYSDPSDIQSSVVLLVNDEGDQGLNSAIEVLKFSGYQYQAAIDHLFINDEEFATTFDDDISVIETSVVEISGMEAREIAYIEQSRLYYLSYMYGVGNTLYRINFICHKDQQNSFKQVFDAIMESYTVTTRAGMSSSLKSETDDNDYSLFAEALGNLITYNTLPDGEIANDLDGKINSIWDKFAICDIDQDGAAELLIKIESGSGAARGQYVYRVNASHTALEIVYAFFNDVVYYDTGFIKEDWSHNQGLSENFWPYNILQWEMDGCREVAGADAWEKMAWETDFQERLFPMKSILIEME